MNTYFRSDNSGVIAAQADSFNLTVTIQVPDMSVDPRTGQQNVKSHKSYANLLGHTQIACKKASTSPNQTGPGAAETKQVSMTQDVTYFHILLLGFYPEINASMQAAIDGSIIRAGDGRKLVELTEKPELHDILGVESDSERTMTRLRTQILVA